MFFRALHCNSFRARNLGSFTADACSRIISTPILGFNFLLTMFILPYSVQRSLSLTEKTGVNGRKGVLLSPRHPSTSHHWPQAASLFLPCSGSKLKSPPSSLAFFFLSHKLQFTLAFGPSDLLLVLAFLSHNLWQRASLSPFWHKPF